MISENLIAGFFDRRFVRRAHGHPQELGGRALDGLLAREAQAQLREGRFHAVQARLREAQPHEVV